jgi:hypothetical protein
MAIANSNYKFIFFDIGTKEEFPMVVLSTTHHFAKHWNVNWNYHLLMTTIIFLTISLVTKHLPFEKIF